MACTQRAIPSFAAIQSSKWARHNDPGGRPPLGFARTGPERLLAPVDGRELERARRAFALYATGTESDASIGHALGMSEFRVEEVLQNPLYAGRAIRHKGRPDEGERAAHFPAPVDPALFQRVQELRRQRRTRHSAGGGSFGRRPYPLVPLLSCTYCGSRYHGDASKQVRRLRHVARPACTGSLTCRADLVEEQLAKILGEVQLSEADIEAVAQLIEVSEPTDVPDDTAGIARARGGLQDQLAAGSITIEAFSRAWRALERPVSLIRRQATAQQLSQARALLRDFGPLWRDVDVPADLKEQAAREIFDTIELDGTPVVAVHPRAEHAWLLGMDAKRRGGLGMVGARGLAPPITTSAR